MNKDKHMSNNKLLIGIPSKNRAKGCLNNSYRIFKEVAGKTNWIDLKIFVEPQNYQEYKNIGIKQEDLIIIEKNNGGFSYVAKAMSEYATQNNYEFRMKADDDLDFISFNYDYKEKDLITKDLINYLTKSRELCEHYPTIFGGSTMNLSGITAIEKTIKGKIWISPNLSSSTIYFVRNKLYTPIPNISQFEDSMAFLQLQEQNLYMAKYTNTIIKNTISKNGGGMEEYNREELCNKEAKIIFEHFRKTLPIKVKVTPNLFGNALKPCHSQILARAKALNPNKYNKAKNILGL